MTMESVASQKPWGMTVTDGPAGLEIILLKRTFVLPWSQFLYAEGGDEEVQIAFSTHDIIVRGAQLRKLLADLSAQRVSVLEEPVRAERFPSGAMPQITSISVQKVG
jgi:hypothetical protein